MDDKGAEAPPDLENRLLEPPREIAAFQRVIGILGAEAHQPVALADGLFPILDAADEHLVIKRLPALVDDDHRRAAVQPFIDAARLLVHRAAVMKDKGVRHSPESAMAKLFVSEMHSKAALDALQLYGGYGYMMEYPISYMFTSARINRILAGSSEIMKYIIGRDVFSDNYSSLLD